MFRYGVAAALIVSAVAAANSQGLLDRAAALGSCSPLAAEAPSGVQWWECKPGSRERVSRPLQRLLPAR